MPKRYKHNLSNYKLLTSSMGLLVPVQLQEILPGDSLRASSSALIRFAPTVAPVMHPVTVRLHHWFVPMRLCAKFNNDVTQGAKFDWEKFITGGDDGNDSQTIPTMGIAPLDKQLWDYLGVPSIGDITKELNALPLWGFGAIFNEFYRDQDIVPYRTPVGTSVPRVAWGKDYFTTARPEPQKGPDITIPLGGLSPIRTVNSPNDTETNVSTDADGNAYFGQPPNSEKRLWADLANATAANVNDWRRAFALQRYQEARMQYGSRYTEYLNYLGVQSPDSRLQRPEYLGGGKATVNFSEVLQTADTENGNVGEMKGHGIAAVRSRPFTRHFNEHGYFYTLMSVVPKSIYQQGVERLWLRQTKEDFWQRELQQIGQQPVYNDEVYMVNDGTSRNTFGWQDRYAEYKSTRSTVAGDFRDVLDFWHLGRKWEGPPALNSSFIQCTPSERIFADQTPGAQNLWCMVQNTVRARRLVRKSASNRIL